MGFAYTEQMEAMIRASNENLPEDASPQHKLLVAIIAKLLPSIFAIAREFNVRDDEQNFLMFAQAVATVAYTPMITEFNRQGRDIYTEMMVALLKATLDHGNHGASLFLDTAEPKDNEVDKDSGRKVH